jgi:Concanavalin A-like lectin/glucanases superfamily
MGQPAWRHRLGLAAVMAAMTACTFDLADVATGTDDGGTLDAQPGDEAGADATLDDGSSVAEGAAESAADSRSGSDGGADAPSDVVRDTTPLPDTGGDAGPVRVTSGLVVLYRLREGAGPIVHDNSSIAPAADLAVAVPANTTWVADGLRFDTSTVATSVAPAPKIGAALTASSALSLEAWITPAAATSSLSSGRILDFGPNGAPATTNFDFGQIGGSWGGSLRVVAGGAVSTITPAVPVAVAKTHFVLMRDALGTWTEYVNGAQAATGTLAGPFSVWDISAAALSLGNARENGRPFLGTIHLAAIYSRALSAAEVQQNYTVVP